MNSYGERRKSVVRSLEVRLRHSLVMAAETLENVNAKAVLRHGLFSVLMVV